MIQKAINTLSAKLSDDLRCLSRKLAAGSYELRPCFRTPGYFTPVHERGTKRDTIDGSIRTSIRQQRLSGFMNRARHRAALPGSLVSPARS